jgi:enoyl-CoA hydratase/carnithine racemase
MVAVSRAIGRKKAMEMLLTGDKVPAQEAAIIGLVNKVVLAEHLESATRELALKIVESSPLVIGIGKQAFYRQVEMPQRAAYDYTAEVMALNAIAADAQEGFGAFIGKRKPQWSGK